MNQLNKLIEQFAKEEDLPAFMIHALIREVEDEKGTWLNKLLEFLAPRPTCGKEQRKFLDEVERATIDGDEVFDPDGDIILFTCDWKFLDLQKVIKGE